MFFSYIYVIMCIYIWFVTLAAGHPSSSSIIIYSLCAFYSSFRRIQLHRVQQKLQELLFATRSLRTLVALVRRGFRWGLGRRFRLGRVSFLLRDQRRRMKFCLPLTTPTPTITDSLTADMIIMLHHICMYTVWTYLCVCWCSMDVSFITSNFANISRSRWSNYSSFFFCFLFQLNKRRGRIIHSIISFVYTTTSSLDLFGTC